MFLFHSREVKQHEHQQDQQQDHLQNLQQHHQEQEKQTQPQNNDEVKLSFFGGFGGSRTSPGAGAGAGASSSTTGSDDGNDDDKNKQTNSSTTKKIQEEQKQKIPQKIIYKPRIDRYTCIGKYIAYTDRTMGNTTSTDASTGNTNTRMQQIVDNMDNGVEKKEAKQSLKQLRQQQQQTQKKRRSDDSMCNGYMSKMETLQFFNEMTRADAIKQFINEYEDIDDDDSSNNYSNNNRSNNNFSHYKLEDASESDVLIFSSPSNKDLLEGNPTNTDPDKDSSIIKFTTDTTVKEETISNKKSWKCYGSTDVDYLILKNVQTGIESIAAVVPKTRGYSKCTVSNNDHRIIKNVLDFGPICINYIQNQKEYENVKDIVEKTAKQRKENIRKYLEEQEKLNKIYTVSDIIPETIKFTKLVQANTYTILNNTKMNILWLGSVVQDDFANRVYTSTKRIVYNIPTVISITTTYWSKILSKNDNNNNDDDNNNNNGSTGSSNFPRRR